MKIINNARDVLFIFDSEDGPNVVSEIPGAVAIVKINGDHPHLEEIEELLVERGYTFYGVNPQGEKIHIGKKLKGVGLHMIGGINYGAIIIVFCRTSKKIISIIVNKIMKLPAGSADGSEIENVKDPKIGLIKTARRELREETGILVKDETQFTLVGNLFRNQVGFGGVQVKQNTFVYLVNANLNEHQGMTPMDQSEGIERVEQMDPKCFAAKAYKQHALLSIIALKNQGIYDEKEREDAIVSLLQEKNVVSFALAQ